MTTQVLENYPLANIAIRSFVILVITFGLAIANRRRSAAVNHRIWVLDFCGCLVIPIVTLLSPNWTLPLLPSPKSIEAITDTVTIQSDTLAHSDVVNSQEIPVQRTPFSAPRQHSPKARPTNQELTTHRPPTVAHNSLERASLARWGLIVWCVGMAIVVSRQIQQVLVMRRILRQCKKIESESWCSLRDTAAHQLGVLKKVTLRSHLGAVSPMVVGPFRPVVLLPSDAETWSLERRKQALLHELAHVQRRDVLTQWIAGLACAIYWFNPLAWWGASEMKRLREIACDDAVVTHTSKPSSYAQTLLDVAKNYRSRQQICTVAMARTANVEGRIGAILDATRRRASLSKRSARIIGVAALLLSTLVGSLQLSSRADEQNKTPTDKEASTEKSGESRTLRMAQGIAFSGSITGPDGKPVTKGLVIWHDDQRGRFLPDDARNNVTQIDSFGRYETKRLAPRDYLVTVLAPGFAPAKRTIQVSPSLQDIDFKLEPGNSVRLEIVDQSDNPIPEAFVGIIGWRGWEVYFYGEYSWVPESGIPLRPNQDGVYSWDWAPVDGVEYRISAKGYDTKKVTLVAQEETHQVELSPLMTIFGNVVDAESGEPIERFRVIPVKAYRQNLDFYSTNFRPGRIAHGKDGEYTIQINSSGQTGNRYRVRIEAEGYRTAFGQKSLGVGDSPLEEDFELEQAPAVVGTVLDASGKPVNAFTVAVGTPTASPSFDVENPDDDTGIAFRVKGTNKFELAATFEPSRIRVFNDSGFAEVLRQPDEPIGTITLEPWASVSGRLVQDGKPIPNEWITFFPLVERALTEARFQDGFSAKTDVDGYFRFDRLPPMSGRVRAHLGPWRDSLLTSSRSVPLDLKPGDRKEVSLGGEGATITGRVVATGRSNDELSKNWSLNYLVSRSRGAGYPSDAEPLSFDASGPMDAAWLRQPDFDSWLATRENHFVKLADDGRLRIHGVRPGSYDLVIQLYEQPAGCLVETIGEKVVPVTITEDDVRADGVEVGDIEVECRIGPRVGSNMRAFKFTDSQGRVRFIDEMGGRYVLFHVWASWCEPCLVSMPEVKSTVEQHSDDPLTVVGLNIDKDVSVAKALVQHGGWSWAQNYLGDDSDMMHQLGVSSVPAYYLIGPDGKLVGSANAWGQIEQLLSAELR